jgi:hypothetical protein
MNFFDKTERLLPFDLFLALVPLTEYHVYTRWFKYDRDKLWLVCTQIVPVIFEPPCVYIYMFVPQVRKKNNSLIARCRPFHTKSAYIRRHGQLIRFFRNRHLWTPPPPSGVNLDVADVARMPKGLISYIRLCCCSTEVCKNAVCRSLDPLESKS